MNVLNIAFNVISKLKKTKREITQFNSVEKSYLLAQLFFIIGLTLLPTVLPLVINAITGETAKIGIINAISTWAIMIATFFSGNIIKLFSMRKLLIGQSFAQVILYLAVTVLLFEKQLTIPLLILVLIISGMVSTLSTLLNTDKAGSNRIFSTAEKKETALYIYNLFFYISMVILPIFFGVLIDSIGKRIGVESALATAYLLFCASMLTCGIIYIKNVYPSKDTILHISNKKPISRKNILFKTHTNMWDATKIVWHNSALRVCFLFTSIEAFICKPFSIVVLPTLAIDILHRGATGNGLLLGATNAGGMLATILLLSGKRLQKKYGFYRYIFWLAVFSSCAFIPSIFLWKYPLLWIAAPASLCIQFFLEPLSGRVELLVQLEVNGDEKAKAEEPNIFGLLELTSNLALSVGCIVFGSIFLHSSSNSWLYSFLGSYAPLKIITLLLAIYGVINILTIIWFKRHIYHTYPLGYISEEEEMHQLEDRLQHEHLPHSLTEVFQTPIPAAHPTIVLLASATDDHLAQARADRTHYSKDIHLVLDSAWILEELQEDGTNRIYLKKGLYFDREGDPILAEYKVPRLIHYFANFYNPSDPLNISTVNLENRLDTPMSASSRLQDLINESLLMRIWLSSRGILAPITCAFLMPDHKLISEINTKEKKPLLSTFIVSFPVDEIDKRNIIREQLLTFLSLYHGHELVIKPSGSGITPPEGVEFFTADDIEGMVEHVMALSQHRLMTSTSAILIEECFHPPALFLSYNQNDGSGRYCILEKPTPLHILSLDEIATADETTKKEWVVHVLAARTPWNKCLTTGLIARADNYGQPLTKSAAVIPFENMISALRIQHGLFKTDDEIWALEKEIDDLATQVLLAIDEEQKQYPPAANDPLQSQVDYFGLDLIFLSINGVLKPKIIAFHDHTVGRQYQFDSVYPELLGEHSKIWFATMFSRARQSACKGKRLLLVGAGDETRRPFLECAIKLGIEIILLEQELSWAKDLVSEFLMVTHDKDVEVMRQQALLAISQSISSFGAIDGITTYCTQYIMATAELARDLNLPYLSVSNARTTTNKLKIQTTLSAASLAVPLYFHVTDENKLEIILHQINRIQHTTGLPRFPMIIKPLFESKNINVTKVHGLEEIRSFFQNFGSNYTDKSFVIEEFIEGKEFFADVVIQDSKIKHSAITDNESKLIGETLLPNKHSLPCTQLQTQEQQACINLATLSLHALEISDGIIHIKGIYEANQKGAYILEIHPCPAERYLSLWHHDVWGIDIPELFFAIALQIPINAQASDVPLTYLESYNFITTQGGIFQEWTGLEQLAQCPGFKTFYSLAKAGDRITVAKDEFKNLGYLIVEGQTKAEALAHFENCVSKIHYTTRGAW
jgi:biotin carboxylase